MRPETAILPAVARIARATPARLHASTPAIVCFILGLLGALPLVLLTPPFQVPDEAQHFARAYQLSEGSLWSEMRGGRVGADLPASLSASIEHVLGSTQEHADHPVRPQPLAETLADLARPLAPDDRAFLGFAGAAVYSPLPYVPQILGIWMGRAFALGPLGLLYMGRLFNVLASLALVALATRLTPIGKNIVLVTGLLPMALYQDASLSPDAMVIASAFVFVALALRAQAHGGWRRPDMTGAILAGTLVCSLKPVYAPMLVIALVPDLFVKERRRDTIVSHLLIVGFVAAISFAWLQSTSSIFILPRPGTSLRGQAAFMATAPLDVLMVLARTLVDKSLVYYQSTIGMFGWMKIRAPDLLYQLPVFAAAVLLFAERERSDAADKRAASWHIMLALVCFGLVLIALYLIWTPVAMPVVEGVQGRYFLPFLGLAGIAILRLTPPLGKGLAPSYVLASLVVLVLMQIMVCDLTIVGAYTVF